MNVTPLPSARWFATLGLSLSLALLGCSTDDDDVADSPVQSGQAALSESVTATASASAARATAPPASRSLSELTVEWADASTVQQQQGGRKANQAMNLIVHNHVDEAITSELVVEGRGLRTKRVQSLGTFVVPPRSSLTVGWKPATHPILPSGTLGRYLPVVRYAHADRALSISGPVLFGTFNRAATQGFFAFDDGERALDALRHADGASQSTSARPSLAKLGGRFGRLDGNAVEESAEQAGARMGTSPDDDLGDTLSREGSLEPDATTSVIVPPITVKPCLGPPVNGVSFYVRDYVSSKICGRWRPSGYRDVAVYASGVTEETYDPTRGATAFANAQVYRNGVQIWSGRTDSQGCTPVLQYCEYHPNLRVDVSTASLMAPGNLLTGYPASREIKISPSRVFTASVSFYQLTPSGAFGATANVMASTAQDDYILRVASIVSRMLSMPDGGIRTANQSPTPLQVHTENGCCSHPELRYGVDPNGNQLCGEACANESDVFFGPSLSFSSGTGTPTGLHTTADAYTIGHELGHAIQFDGDGSPGSPVYDEIGANDCSCEHVMDGNRIHCLQSRHPHLDAFAEGWAHFYAARIMNNKGAGARFTYYKNVRTKSVFYSQGIPVVGTGSKAPPVPIEIGSPFAAPLLGTTGWVRSYCAAANRGAEYDWLTYLWALNGKNSAGQLSMTSLFSFFGNHSLREAESFTWPNIATQAANSYGIGSATHTLITSAAQINGINL